MYYRDQFVRRSPRERNPKNVKGVMSIDDSHPMAPGIAQLIFILKYPVTLEYSKS